MDYHKKFSKYMPMGGFPTRKGSALQVSISQLKNGNTRLFVEMAPQVKDKPPAGSSESPFSWEKKIFIALKEDEVGSLMALFRRRVKSVDVIHKYPIDAPVSQQKTTTLSVKESEHKGQINWSFTLAQKMGTNAPQKEQMYLQSSDAEILMLFMQKCLEQMYNL